MSTMPTDAQILTPDEVDEIAAAAEALKGVYRACDLTHAKPEFINYVLTCNPSAVSALCHTVRALRADVEELAQKLIESADKRGEVILRLAAAEQELTNLRAENTYLHERLGIQEGHCKRLQGELGRVVKRGGGK